MKIILLFHVDKYAFILYLISEIGAFFLYVKGDKSNGYFIMKIKDVKTCATGSISALASKSIKPSQYPSSSIAPSGAPTADDYSMETILKVIDKTRKHI